ncbi:MAG TPA: single-stranded DNA-binding protein [Candidatus Paceibacterota bacterium]|nr:single-stranded DNA-binding protein [Candidatus Paceibacterota bacterium]
MYLNKAMIYGNLTRNPEMRALPSGMQVCTFGIATNRVYNDRDGKRQEATEYHNIVVFGKQGENCAKYLTKGASAFVEGSLRTTSWEKDGAKQYRTEIVADRVQFGPRGGGAPASDAKSNSVIPDRAPDMGGMPEYPEEEINPEDIPF